jgi:FdhD protein
MTAMPKPADVREDASALCSRAVSATAVFADGATEQVSWQLPDEVPVALQFNSEPYTVMMATPADLRDFAVGLALAEGLIRDAGAIQGVLVMPVEGGITLDIAVAEDALDSTRMVHRAIEGRSGCGLCGVQDIEAANRPLPRLDRDHGPRRDAILKAARDLKAAQPMNRLNRSVHGAAFVSGDGHILVVREDVGRHNALDKLIGALARSDIDRTSGFVLMTSRCSYELVQKSVTVGLPALVTVSAPTTLALDLAISSNLFLAALGPGGSVVTFNA